MIRIFFVVLIVLGASGVIQGQNLSDYLSFDPKQTDTLISFASNTSLPFSITGIHVHFLTSPNCYSGYQNGFYLHQNNEPLHIERSGIVSLIGHSIYSLGNQIVKNVEIDEIHSILIRLLDDNKSSFRHQFFHFLGECADQEVNCCIEVVCSDVLKTCMPNQNLGLQYMTLDLHHAESLVSRVE